MKINRHTNCVLFLFLSLSRTFFGQILSIDREIIGDTIERKITGLIDLSFSSDKQKNDILELTQQTELDFRVKSEDVFIFLTQTDFVFNGPTVLENNGYFQLRFRNNDTKRVAPDYFFQYQWNGITGLQNRALAGMNARFKFWDDRKDDLYVSAGLFYEYEKWNPFLSNYAFGGVDLNQIERNLIRFNFSVKTAFQLTKGIDLTAISYIQSPLNAGVQNILNPRWSMDSQVNFQMNKHLLFTIKYNFNLDYYRPLPIDSFFYSLTFGVRIQS